MSRLLIITDWFAPGFRAGGPIRSCINLANALRHHMEVYVLTTDTDFGTLDPYPNIASDQWIEWENGINVYYTSRRKLRPLKLAKVIRSVEADTWYLNSMFSPFFTLMPIVMGWTTNNNRIVLAPRGMLHAGALKYKTLKKRLFLAVLQQIGFPPQLRFQATDDREALDIKQHLAISEERIRVLPNIPQTPAIHPKFAPKRAGELKILFAARLSPKKNLSYILERLSEITVKGIVQITIVGPYEDNVYWAHCQKLIRCLPSSIVIQELGPIPPARINRLLEEHHIFVLPTFGENFGHGIFEALGLGRPVLISDQTPWRNLVESRAGWDLPLQDTRLWISILEQIICANQKEFDQWVEGAWNYAVEFYQHEQIVERYRQWLIH